MLASATPVYFQQPFANNAGAGYTRAIPNTTADTTAASLNLGFPPACFVDVALGGTPPNGMDFNGIFNEITANIQWVQAGGFATYNSAFSTAIGGYPNGAILAMANGKGFWRSTADNNVTDPDTSGAGWVVEAISPGAYLDLSVAGAADVTLTTVQAANNIIDMTGLLTGNINLIVPTVAGEWTFANNTTGAFSITVKTVAGTGIVVPQGSPAILYCDGVNVYAGATPGISQASADARYGSSFFPVSASVGSNALTLGLAACKMDFRNATLGTGTPVNASIAAPLSITIPSTATLGTVNGVAARLVALVAYNAGAPVLCITNIAGGLQLDETNLISPTTISTGATANNVIYSASAVGANSPYRVIGFVDVTEATAGTWATAPSTVQPCGGQALAALSSLGYGQTWKDVTGSRVAGTTYYNGGKPIAVYIAGTNVSGQKVTVNGVAIGGSTGTQPGLVVIPPDASYVYSNGTLSGWQELS